MIEHTRKMTVLIVDDEPLSRRGIAIRLQEHSDMAIAGECENGAEAVEAILRLKPDLVFLDIQMDDMSGIDALLLLPPQSMPCIIFVTAYDEYALAAFEVQALDYLLKPIEDARFVASLDRARRIVALQQKAAIDGQVDMLLQPHTGRSNLIQSQRFSVRSGNCITFVQLDDIDWIEAVGDYAGLHVGNRTHLVRETLRSLEATLDKNRFLRIHRSTIVHLSRIARIRPLASHDCQLTLHDGTSLRVSRTYSKSLRSLLRNAIGRPSGLGDTGTMAEE